MKTQPPSHQISYLFVMGVGILMILLGLTLTGTSARALDNSVFTVKDIRVDITAKSAESARQQAFDQAQQEAFRRLTRRILRFEDASLLPEPDEGTLRRLIQDFEIRNEQISSIRYKAAFVFRFQQEAVRSYFDSQGLSYTDVGSKPVLVLPFYQSDIGMELWSRTNPWLGAWSRAEGNQGLVPVVIPLGDLQDVQNIRDDEALSYDNQKLRSMVERYNAGEAIVTIAAQPRQHSPQNQTPDDILAYAPLTIFIYRTDTRQPEFVTKITLAPENNESNQSLYDRSVARVFALLQRNWKEQTIVNPDEKNALVVRVRYRSLDEWVLVKNSLRDVQGLLDVSYLSITPHQAHIRLFFKGSEQRLRLALAQEDMLLSRPRVNLSSLLLDDDDENHNSAAPLSYDLKLRR